MSASSALSLSRHGSSPAADRPSRLPHTPGMTEQARSSWRESRQLLLPKRRPPSSRLVLRQSKTCLRPDEPTAGLAVLSHIRCLHGKHSEHALSSSFQTASGSIACTAGRQPLPTLEKKVQLALSKTTCHPDEQTQEEAP